MTDGNLNNTTVAGLIAFCDWLTDKGYATNAQVNPWKIATRKVFEMVEGDNYESLDLSGIDLDEYLTRFQTLAGAQYKAESITAYKRRIANAIDAHRHYLDTGRPPTFRQGTRRAKAEDKGSGSGSVVKLATKSGSAGTPTNGLHVFTYPLANGQIVKFELPPRMKGDDVNRVCAFIRTLQDDQPEPKQITSRAGEDAEAA